MSKDFCMDCGMLLSPNTSICSSCGFDNDFDYSEPLSLDLVHQITGYENPAPENYPGY